jgi:hypothetical protein
MCDVDGDGKHTGTRRLLRRPQSTAERGFEAREHAIVLNFQRRSCTTQRERGLTGWQRYIYVDVIWRKMHFAFPKRRSRGVW